MKRLSKVFRKLTVWGCFMGRLARKKLVRYWFPRLEMSGFPRDCFKESNDSQGLFVTRAREKKKTKNGNGAGPNRGKFFNSHVSHVL